MISIIVILYALGGVLMYYVCSLGGMVKPDRAFNAGTKTCAIIAWPICALYLIKGLS